MDSENRAKNKRAVIGCALFGFAIGWLMAIVLDQPDTESPAFDITALTGAAGGAALTKLIPEDKSSATDLFYGYAIGLILAMVTAKVSRLVGMSLAF